MKGRTHSVEETEAWAGRLARIVRQRLGPGEQLLIGLIGPLGAGKTAFVRGFVHGLDPQAAKDVRSPTYAVVHEYPSTPKVVHVDLYRLESLADLEAIGHRELFFGPGVTLVEWIDAIEEAIPADWLEIRLAVRGEDVREWTALAHGARAEAILTEDAASGEE